MFLVSKEFFGESAYVCIYSFFLLEIYLSRIDEGYEIFSYIDDRQSCIFFIHKHATFIRADHLKKIWKDLFPNNKGRRQKSCSFGGAHHKIAYPPVVVKLPLFCGNFFA